LPSDWGTAWSQSVVLCTRALFLDLADILGTDLGFGLLCVLLILIYTRLTMQEAALFDRATTVSMGMSLRSWAQHSVHGRGRMRNILGDRMLAADGSDADIRCLASFGEGIIAGIEILAFLW
jgi:hypothetical protein